MMISLNVSHRTMLLICFMCIFSIGLWYDTFVTTQWTYFDWLEDNVCVFWTPIYLKASVTCNKVNPLPLTFLSLCPISLRVTIWYNLREMVKRTWKYQLFPEYQIPPYFSKTTGLEYWLLLPNWDLIITYD